MKIEKEPEGSWNYQLSIKLGRNNQHLLNIRAEGWDAFKEALQKITEDANDEEGSLVNDTIVALEPEPEPFSQPTGGGGAGTLPLADVRATPPPASVNVKSEQGEEVGPLTVTSIAPQQGVGKNGRPYTVFKCVFGNGAVKASTFDSLVAQVTQTLLGKQAYVRVNKTRFGYDLLNVRPAA